MNRKQGVQVTVIPDAAMGYWLERADAVLVGADAIKQNGDFIGKIGCLPLACLARRQKITFYLRTCPGGSGKWVLNRARVAPPAIE